MAEPKDASIAFDMTRLLFAGLGALVFVAGGIWMLSLDSAAVQRMGRGDSVLFPHAVGVVAILFFGLGAIVLLGKAFGGRPALAFDARGVFENTSAMSVGPIVWDEIVGVKIYQAQKRKLIVLQIKDPEQILKRVNFLKRFVLRRTLKRVGSPVIVSTRMLAVEFTDVLSILQSNYRKYKYK